MAEPIVGKIQCLKDAELRGENVVYSLSTFESDFVSTEVEHAKAVILETELFYSVYGIAIQQILSETQLLKTPIDL